MTTQMSDAQPTPPSDAPTYAQPTPPTDAQAYAPRLGLRCPECASTNDRTLEVRASEASTRRRRLCLDCNTRHTTYELSQADYAKLLSISKEYAKLSGKVSSFIEQVSRSA